MTERTERPVLSGLVALLGVAVSVGLVLGLGALVVVRVAGLDGGSDSAGATSEESMYLPEPERTGSPRSGQPRGGGGEPREAETSSSAPATPITLSAAETAVGPMQQINLSGTFPGGDGAILQVQRFSAGGWIDFPVTASVSGGGFATYVQTGQTGVNRFRMIDSDSAAVSNEVKVTVG